MRRLDPWHVNTGKRMTKAPKVFVRDTGLLHILLEISTMDQLLGHPSVGPSYESLAAEALIGAAGDTFRPHHYRSRTTTATARGDEIDLVLVRGGRPVIAVEVTRSTAPVVGPGFHRAVAVLAVGQAYVVHPDTGRDPYAVSPGVTAYGLSTLVRRLRAESAA